jgi:hypothetical protein
MSGVLPTEMALQITGAKGILAGGTDPGLLDRIVPEEIHDQDIDTAVQLIELNTISTTIIVENRDKLTGRDRSRISGIEI